MKRTYQLRIRFTKEELERAKHLYKEGKKQGEWKTEAEMFMKLAFPYFIKPRVIPPVKD